MFIDERFARSRIREQNRSVLEPILEEHFLTRDRDTWVSILRQHDVPVAPVNSFLELQEDPDVVANGYIVEQEDREWGRVKVVGHPFHMSQTPAHVQDWTPELGEDTCRELRAAGVTEHDLDRLLHDEVVHDAARRKSALDGDAR